MIHTYNFIIYVSFSCVYLFRMTTRDLLRTFPSYWWSSHRWWSLSLDRLDYIPSCSHQSALVSCSLNIFSVFYWILWRPLVSLCSLQSREKFVESQSLCLAPALCGSCGNSWSSPSGRHISQWVRSVVSLDNRRRTWTQSHLNLGTSCNLGKLEVLERLYHDPGQAAKSFIIGW